MSITLTPQSNVTFVSVPFDASGKHTLYFADKTAQQTYFTGLSGYTVNDYTYVKKDGSIKVGLNYELMRRYNYLYYINLNESISDQGQTANPKIIYAFIVGMEYINENSTKIYFKTDTFQTYLTDILADTTSISYINKQHIKKSEDTASGIKKYLLPENLETGEYVCSESAATFNFKNASYSLTTPGATSTSDSENIKTNANKLDYLIICGCTQVIQGVGSESMFTQRNFGGIYSGLYYYGFGDNDSLSNFIAYLNYSGAINAIYSMFVIPKSICANWAIRFQSVTFTPEGMSTGTFDIYYWIPTVSDVKDFGTLNCALSSWTAFSNAGTTAVGTGYTPHNYKLYTYPYSYLQLLNGCGGAQNYHLEYFNDINNPSFAIKGILCQGGSIICYPLNYKGRTSNTAELLNCAKYPTCSWNTDSYTNWLTQTAVTRSNTKRYAEEDRAQGLITKGIELGTEVAKAAKGDYSASNVVGALESIYNTQKNYERTLDSLEAEKKQHSLIPDSINNGAAVPDLLYAIGEYAIDARIFTITGERAKQIDEYFDRFGYTVNVNRNIVQAITSRSIWNYVKTADCVLNAPNVPDEDLMEIKALFNEGITIWKNPSTIYRYDLGSSNNQEVAAWEKQKT